MLVPPENMDAYMAMRAEMMAPQTAPATTYTRYGVTWCVGCGYQVTPIQYCRCVSVPADAPAGDGPLTGLEQRVRDCQVVP